MKTFFKENDLVIGVVKSTSKKYGFLVTDDGELFIPPMEFQKLFSGDIAKGEVFFKNNKPQVKIIKVVENKYKDYIGIYKETEKGDFVVPEKKDELTINQWLRIPKSKKGRATDGDYVKVQIIEYPIVNKKPKGEIVKIIGKKNSPNFEANYYFEKANLPVYFSNGIIDKSFEFDQSFIKEKKSKRKDLTMLPFVTIDGENTRDLDDAIFCKKNDNGWKVWVAISDVSAFLEEGGDIDKEAFKRTTSVYTPLKYASMLPENLSSNLCSLMADVERLALVCYMQIDNSGEVKNYSFYEAVIRTRARLSYNDINEYIINGSLNKEYEVGVTQNLKSICELHGLLREYRKENFVLNPREDNVRYNLDENRQPIGISVSEYTEANEVVEEIMLLANMSAANFISENFEKGVYRVNNGLEGETIRNLAPYLKDIGISFNGDLGELKNFKKIFPSLSKHKTLMKAMSKFINKNKYSIVPGSHLSLGVKKYTYFTSPIRRYADIIVHRMIKSIIYNKKHKDVSKETIKHLNSVEANISRVRANIKKEMDCKLILKLDTEGFYGTITDINRIGCKILLDFYNIEGFLHTPRESVETVFNESIKKLTSGGLSLQLGDRVFVKLLSVDEDNNSIFFKQNDK